MPYRACVFQHGSDYTHVHSKQIALSFLSIIPLSSTIQLTVHSVRIIHTTKVSSDYYSSSPSSFSSSFGLLSALV